MSVRVLRPRVAASSIFRSTRSPLPIVPQRASRAYSDHPETLTAHRTLPYPTLPIYDIITSIESYPDFIPFCTSAHITSFSQPDGHYKRRWPQHASLTIGYGTQINETFVSKIFCAPPIPEKGRAGLGIVEAISGSAEHNIDPEMIEHHTSDASNETKTTSGPMEYLRTRWTVKNYPYKPAPGDGSPPQEGDVEPEPKARQMTDVSLSLEYKFSNPIYEMMSKAVAGKIADKMIEAFVKRVEAVLKDRGEAAHTQEKRFE